MSLELMSLELPCPSNSPCAYSQGWCNEHAYPPSSGVILWEAGFIKEMGHDRNKTQHLVA